MFEVIYLSVLALAALPLARTLMQGSGGDRIALVHRLYRDAAYILVAGLAIIGVEVALGISLEIYWFRELGQSHRYWLSLEYRVAIFLVVLLAVGLFVGANLRMLARSYAAVPPSAPLIVGLGFAAVVGFFATPLWVPLMRFLGAEPAGIADPVFGRDISFYLLALPLYDDIVDFVIGILGRDNRGLDRHRNDGWRNAGVRQSPGPGGAVSHAGKRRGAVATAAAAGGLDDLDTAGLGSRCIFMRHPCGQSVLGPLSPRSERTLEGGGRRLLCRRQFLAARLRPRGRVLARGRGNTRAGGGRSERSRLVVAAAVALARARRDAGAACRGRLRGSRRDRGYLCRAEPDHARAAVSRQEYRRHPPRLQPRGPLGRGARVRGVRQRR